MTDKVEPSVPISELQHIVDNVSALKDMRIKIESFRKEWEAAHAADRAWEAKEKALRELVNQQAEDEGLWFDATTAPEAYLQQELRKLHVAIEGKSIGEAILNREQEKQP